MLFFCEEYSRDQGWVGKLIGLHNLTVFMHWNGENGQHRYQVSALYQASALSLSFQFYIVMNVFKLPLNLTITAE